MQQCIFVNVCSEESLCLWNASKLWVLAVQLKEDPKFYGIICSYIMSLDVFVYVKPLMPFMLKFKKCSNKCMVEWVEWVVEWVEDIRDKVDMVEGKVVDTQDEVDLEDKVVVVLVEWEANNKTAEIKKWGMLEEIQEVDQMLGLFNHKIIKIKINRDKVMQDKAEMPTKAAIEDFQDQV